MILYVLEGENDDVVDLAILEIDEIVEADVYDDVEDVLALMLDDEVELLELHQIIIHQNDELEFVDMVDDEVEEVIIDEAELTDEGMDEDVEIIITIDVMLLIIDEVDDEVELAILINDEIDVNE